MHGQNGADHDCCTYAWQWIQSPYKLLLPLTGLSARAKGLACIKIREEQGFTIHLHLLVVTSDVKRDHSLSLLAYTYLTQG